MQHMQEITRWKGKARESVLEIRFSSEEDVFIFSGEEGVVEETELGSTIG